MSSLKCMNDVNIPILNSISSQFLICPKHAGGHLPDHTHICATMPLSEETIGRTYFFLIKVSKK